MLKERCRTLAAAAAAAALLLLMLALVAPPQLQAGFEYASGSERMVCVALVAAGRTKLAAVKRAMDALTAKRSAVRRFWWRQSQMAAGAAGPAASARLPVRPHSRQQQPLQHAGNSPCAANPCKHIPEPSSMRATYQSTSIKNSPEPKHCAAGNTSASKTMRTRGSCGAQIERPCKCRRFFSRCCAPPPFSPSPHSTPAILPAHVLRHPWHFGGPAQSVVGKGGPCRAAAEHVHRETRARKKQRSCNHVDTSVRDSYRKDTTVKVCEGGTYAHTRAFACSRLP